VVFFLVVEAEKLIIRMSRSARGVPVPAAAGSYRRSGLLLES
jgi:hypothetical protein